MSFGALNIHDMRVANNDPIAWKREGIALLADIMVILALGALAGLVAMGVLKTHFPIGSTVVSNPIFWSILGGGLAILVWDVVIYAIATAKAKATAQICMTAIENAGYIGEASKRQLLPQYLLEITSEDDTSLPLDPQDSVLEVALFNCSRKMQALKLPPLMHLPRSLFKDDSKSIKFKYKGQLIELTIEQENHGLHFTKGKLKDVLEAHDTYIKDHCNVHCPFFTTIGPYWYYRLGEIFKFLVRKIDNEAKTCELTPVNASYFRPLVNPANAPADVLIKPAEKRVLFVMEWPRFEIVDLDVILNDTHIIFYGRFQNRPLVEGLKETHSKEAIFSQRWDKMDCFQDSQTGRPLSIEKMREKIKQSACFFYQGQLQVSIPTSQPATLQQDQPPSHRVHNS